MFEGHRISFHASGREALRIAFERLATATGRDEIVIPAYCCFSIPAAAVAAGLNVRLVDVDQKGRIDLASLADLPLQNAAALVVGNLFGVPEPVEPLARITREAGVHLVDDAAQTLGAECDGQPVGSRPGRSVAGSRHRDRGHRKRPGDAGNRHG